jgi:hypothetical protein
MTRINILWVSDITCSEHCCPVHAIHAIEWIKAVFAKIEHEKPVQNQCKIKMAAMVWSAFAPSLPLCWGRLLVQAKRNFCTTM